MNLTYLIMGALITSFTQPIHASDDEGSDESMSESFPSGSTCTTPGKENSLFSESQSFFSQPPSKLPSRKHTPSKKEHTENIKMEIKPITSSTKFTFFNGKLNTTPQDNALPQVTQTSQHTLQKFTFDSFGSFTRK